jgi:hypothetical protein
MSEQEEAQIPLMVWAARRRATTPVSEQEKTSVGTRKRYEDCKTWEEAEAHLQQVAERLKERYSHIPFYAEKAKRNPEYWRDSADSAVNAF